MQQHFRRADTAQFLNNARMGAIMPPAQLRAELRSLKQLPPIANFAVTASMPNWMVEKLNPDHPIASSFTVYPTVDRLDTLMLATLQCGNGQLRCILQLSDPLVSAFLTDALKVGVFTFLFRIENTQQCAVMGTPLELGDPKVLQRHLQGARRSGAGVAPAIQLTSLACHPAFVPSLIDGHNVDDVITLLAHTPTRQELEAALTFTAAPDVNSDAGKLH